MTEAGLITEACYASFRACPGQEPHTHLCVFGEVFGGLVPIHFLMRGGLQGERQVGGEGEGCIPVRP